jgi:hypothetical protein
MDLLFERLAWKRDEGANEFVGLLRGCGGIRLSGRDPMTGVDLTLSVPPDEVDHLYASPTAAAGVVVELGDSEPIVLSGIQAGPLQTHQLPRPLRSLLLLPRLHIPGGRDES